MFIVLINKTAGRYVGTNHISIIVRFAISDSYLERSTSPVHHLLAACQLQPRPEMLLLLCCIIFVSNNSIPTSSSMQIMDATIAIIMPHMKPHSGLLLSVCLYVGRHVRS